MKGSSSFKENLSHLLACYQLVTLFLIHLAHCAEWLQFLKSLLDIDIPYINTDISAPSYRQFGFIYLQSAFNAKYPNYSEPCKEAYRQFLKSVNDTHTMIRQSGKSTIGNIACDAGDGFLLGTQVGGASIISCMLGGALIAGPAGILPGAFVGLMSGGVVGVYGGAIATPLRNMIVSRTEAIKKAQHAASVAFEQARNKQCEVAEAQWARGEIEDLVKFAEALKNLSRRHEHH